ncbi:MAG: DUF4258 domain-containing protein [Cytophagales bacterium]|nr:DUF4258 domain-containing protein [Cytophagales bacterium]
MKIVEIIDAIQANQLNITFHAKQEARNDLLVLDDILFSVSNGEVIEDYQTDMPYPSCLIYGKSSGDEPIHSVWAYDPESKIAILITVYRPNPNRWINFKKRKKT